MSRAAIPTATRTGAARRTLTQRIGPEIRAQRLRHFDGPIRSLMRLEDAGDRAGEGERGSVERVDETRLAAAGRPVANAPAAGLEVDKGAARGDLEPLTDAWGPRLDVVRLRARES